MREDCLQILRQYIISALIKYATDPSKNIFDGLVSLMQTNWSQSSKNMIELRQAQKTKEKGDLFEHFAFLYFKHCFVYKHKKPNNIWLLEDLPSDIALKLGLKHHDLGIDLIIEFDSGEYAAIQAKYRKPNHYKPYAGLSWKDLSTFYALVNRTGPYIKHIVITNANYARHIGHKEEKDLSLCIGTLRNISIDDWHKMAQMETNTTISVAPKNTDGTTSITTTTISIGTVTSTTPSTTTSTTTSTSTTTNINNAVQLRLPRIRPRLTQITQTIGACDNQTVHIQTPLSLSELRTKRCTFLDKLTR